MTTGAILNRAARRVVAAVVAAPSATTSISSALRTAAIRPEECSERGLVEVLVRDRFLDEPTRGTITIGPAGWSWLLSEPGFTEAERAQAAATMADAAALATALAAIGDHEVDAELPRERFTERAGLDEARAARAWPLLLLACHPFLSSATEEHVRVHPLALDPARLVTTLRRPGVAPFREDPAESVVAVARPEEAGTELAAKRVFISYSHDSEGDVRRLVQRLRGHGVAAIYDEFEQAPPNGWRQWMREQIVEAEFILTVCSAPYRRRFEGTEAPGNGKGAAYEARIIGQMLYDGQLDRSRVIPVFFDADGEQHIPTELKDATHYGLDARYEALLRHITGQPAVVPAPLGTVPKLDPVDAGIAVRLLATSDLSTDAVRVLHHACETVLDTDSADGFVDGGDDLMLEAQPPLPRAACAEAIDELEEAGWISGERVYGSGRTWVSFRVTAAGFREYASSRLPDFVQRESRVITRVVEIIVGGNTMYTSHLASQLDEKHAFVCLVLEAAVNAGDLEWTPADQGEYLVHAASARLRRSLRDT